VKAWRTPGRRCAPRRTGRGREHASDAIEDADLARLELECGDVVADGVDALLEAVAEGRGR
jgi:hypothetical protein